MKKVGSYLLLLCTLLLGGCSTATPANNDNATTVAPTVANPTNPNPTQPEAGKTIFKGRALNLQDEPWANTGVRLAEVVRNAQDPNTAACVLSDSTSPGTVTDAEGYFVFANIPAVEYVLIVGDVYGKYKAILGDDLVTRVFSPTTDQVLDVGDIKVDLDAP